jgi:serine-type D-Ala-D-Ala carboxypeptidase/endopeptidase (penicillin-binding protein 4)
MSARTLVAALAALYLAAAPAADAQSRVDPLMQAEAQRITAGAGGEWSAFAWSLDENRIIFSVNGDRALIPASTNKLFTSWWALARLGPDYRFHTEMLVTGPIEDGVLQGDVILRGSGDPSFGYPDFHRDPMDPLRVMAQQLRERGVRRVAGRVIGDASAFDTAWMAPDWPPNASGGAAEYAPRVSGLAYQRNTLWVDLVPTSAGQPARVILHPDIEEIPVDSRATTGGGRAAFAVRNPDDDEIRVMGSVSGRGLNRYRVGVSNPPLLAAGAMRRALLDAGIEVRGRAVTGPAPSEARLVHRHVSVPVRDMIVLLNRDSDNFFAEHLYKAAARDAVGVGSYDLGGPASARFLMEHTGVPAGEVYQADGSGLSRQNRTSARALVAGLRYADGQDWSEVFHRSLAVAGDRSGTMRRMYVNTPGQGVIWGKTGFLRGARSLAGYVHPEGGERIAFAFIHNGGNTNGARAAQIELGVLLTEYSLRGSRAAVGPDTAAAEPDTADID